MKLTDEHFNVHKRMNLIRLLARMSVYYLIVFSLLAVAFRLVPDLIEQLPVGGIEEFTKHETDASISQMLALSSDVERFEEVTETARSLRQRDWFTSARSLFWAMLGTLILMWPTSWVYKAIHKGSVYDHSIDETAMVLPAVVAGIVTVVQHSLALAFSLAGIVAGVRFRRSLNDTFDTLFIFVAIGVGLAAGIGSIEIAVVMSVFFNYVTVIICAFGDGLESQYLAEAKNQKQLRKSQANQLRQNEESLSSELGDASDKYEA